MIRLPLLALILFLPACQSEDSKTETEDSPAPPDPKVVAVEKANLLNQKFELQQQLDQLIASTSLDPDDSLTSLREATLQAQMDFLELRKNHPRLQKLNRELSLWKRNLLSARNSEKSRAESKIMQIQGEIAEISRSLPELSSVEEAISRQSEEAEDLRRSLAEQSPEGQKIVAQIKALEEELNSL